MLGPMGKGSRCTLSCKGGFIDCDQRLLLQAPHLKVQPICLAINLLNYEMLGDTCEKAVIILPDFRVQTICLAINLLDYECLLPAGPVLAVLGISYNINIEVLVNIVPTSKNPFPFQAAVVQEERSAQVNHTWSYLLQHCVLHMSFSDVTDDSYFIFY